MLDKDAWLLYPNYHKWFNKLYVAERLGYNCGPAGIPPSKSGEYVVRPIMNLSGMGLGASVLNIEAGDVSKVPPGYFWCEYFPGRHFSVTYKWIDDPIWPYWEQIDCYEGFNKKESLTYFTKWVKINEPITPPSIFRDLKDIGYINIEYKDNKPFEVHLRTSPDPQYKELIPIWNNTDETIIDELNKKGYKFISSYDDAEGFLANPRIGFMVK